MVTSPRLAGSGLVMVHMVLVWAYMTCSLLVREKLVICCTQQNTTITVFLKGRFLPIPLPYCFHKEATRSEQFQLSSILDCPRCPVDSNIGGTVAYGTEIVRNTLYVKVPVMNDKQLILCLTRSRRDVKTVMTVLTLPVLHQLEQM